MKSTSLKLAATAAAVCMSACISVSAHTSLASFEGQALPALRVGDTICVSFRSLCEKMGYTVNWDGTRAIATGEDTLTAVPGETFLTINGERVELPARVRLHLDRTMVPIRSLASALSLSVTYDSSTGTATVFSDQGDVDVPNQDGQIPPSGENNGDDSNDTTLTPDEPTGEGDQGSNIPAPPVHEPESPEQEDTEAPDDNNNSELENTPSYSETDLYWLARIIEAEAGSESAEGKLAVANVVLNRVDSDAYPDSIYEVIFDTKYGVQFEPTINGTIYNTPSEESVLAAKQALAGENVVGEAIYFYNPSLVDAVWIRTNCTFVQTIGCHNFYM